ncbi:alpha/beta fold hydrolase [Microvirga solisilvae]|uniref:alpha/beta fold hydrolase n=1 Tax=Microvirga solisilvae TaxID=2919498 RepID=UPI001FAF5B09|nr:alpha/beta hydrolase [Microvirga solisilvae]
MSSSYRDLFVSASDGLKLYARDYGLLSGAALPVVCLPGLARNSEDFHELALALSTDAFRPRRVLAVDYRGRGRSAWTSDWRQYDLGTELGDILQVLTVAGIEKAVFVGTSRGGLLTMALNVAKPGLIAGAVLNDVGPVIESEGLIRIRNYVGKLPMPATLLEGAQILKQVSGPQFPAFGPEQWEAMARGTWHEESGRLVLSYDPNLMKPLQELDLTKPMPDLWQLFEGLASVPVLAIRGELSDLLSNKTLFAMQQRHPHLTALTVPGQGHAPLMEGAVLHAISNLIVKVETSL